MKGPSKFIRRSLGASVALGLLLASGCATVSVEGYRQKVTTLVGTQVDDLMIDWGLPDAVDRHDDGSRLLVYHKVEISYVEGDSTGTSTGTEVTRTQVDDGAETTESRSFPIYTYGAAKRVETYCDTMFTIGADHLVKTVEFSGPNCLAKEEKSKSAS